MQKADKYNLHIQEFSFVANDSNYAKAFITIKSSKEQVH